MLRKIPNWCAITTMGLGLSSVYGADPPARQGKLPPVLTVEQARLAQAPTPAAAPAVAPTPATLSAPAVTAAPTPVVATQGEPILATQGSLYGEHCDGCDCPDCEPHYLLPGRRSGCKPPPNNYFHRVLKPKLQWSHWGYCDQFCERPFGPAVSAHFQTQIHNGLAAQMMLYEYDFQEVGNSRGDGLNIRGRTQLERIAGRYQQGLGPVLIASDMSDPQLDAARRKAVERELKGLGVNVRAEDVVTRLAPRPSLNGYESLYLQKNREALILSRGSGGLSGGGGGSSSATPSNASAAPQ